MSDPGPSNRYPIAPTSSYESIDLTADSDDEDNHEGTETPTTRTLGPSLENFHPFPLPRSGIPSIPNPPDNSTSNLNENHHRHSNGTSMMNGQNEQDDFQITAAKIPTPSFIYNPASSSSSTPSSSQASMTMNSSAFRPTPIGLNGYGYANGNGSGKVNGNGNGMQGSMSMSTPNFAGTATSPIDVTQNLPSPRNDSKKPICIGAIMSRGIILYPSEAIIAGSRPPPHSKERYDLVDFRGAEMLRVKLKVSL